MSDSIKELAKSYEENIRRTHSHHPRSIGLFPIPEYPEFESGQGMWSAALDALLTTLRYLAPATLLTLFWGQQSFLFKLLKCIDSAFRAVVFSSEEQKQEVLEWLAEAGPVRVEHLDTVWRHGWILCGVLDHVLPGACAGHPPTRLSLKHAQAIADHYLGVEPVFSRQELESSDSLSRHQEWKLATYLDRIRQALSKVTPPVSKPTSQRTSPESVQVTLDYVARGSGLTAAQLNNKMHFKVYPTSQQSLDPGDITILIRGPKDTYGMYIIPPILGKAQLIRQKLLGLQSKQSFTENVLPLTQGTTYMRSYGKNDMNKTYHIPKTKYDVEIGVDVQPDHAKVSYIVTLEGKYEIFVTSRGQNIVGSPFSMTASNNIVSILEKESFCLEDGEEIDIVDIKSDRKVVLRIVDFVTEKMLLKENGTFEKITDDEAKILMSTDDLASEFTGLESGTCSVASTRSDDDFQEKSHKFNKAACKIVQMNRVCKIITSLLAEKKLKEKSFIRPKSQQTIPDIVNSTLIDANVNLFTMPEKRVLIPENISVSLRTEKAKTLYEPKMKESIIEEGKILLDANIELIHADSLDEYESTHEQMDDILTERPNSSSNPFLNDVYEQNFTLEKDLGSFVKIEYERNKSQNEETEDPPIKILVESVGGTPSPVPTATNPFVEPDILTMERPKTPVLKIITGEIKDRDDSVYLDPRTEQITEELLGNEFINPFYLHHHPPKQNERFPVTDFIIGAPVSLPPIIRASTPEPTMDSIIITDENKKELELNKSKVTLKDLENQEQFSTFSTPIHTVVSNLKEKEKSENNNSSSPTYYSLDSNETDNVEILSLSNDSDNQEPYEALRSKRDDTPKKDIWDSAYVSIDDNNSSPDSNNNDNNVYETHSKQKFSLSDANYKFDNMGPAEREIWESCKELHDTKTYEEPKPKWDLKRPIFTPILEESDRSMSTSMKETARSETVTSAECHAVTVAFAELNDIYRNFYPSDSVKKITKDLDYTSKENDMSVDSASAISDVKRHAEKLEGKISEVQANVTESVSASQTLRENDLEYTSYKKLNQNEETQFGVETHSNIVLEKKHYWDERIREIQAKSSEEDKTQQSRRKLSAKHLRHNDSLTKRRGKQLMKNVLRAEKEHETETGIKVKEVVNRKSPISCDNVDKHQADIKLVEKWKQYWDNKLESEKEETDTFCFRAKSPRSKDSSVSPQLVKCSTEDLIEAYNEPLNNRGKSLPAKQELPEEVFKAFETSPKRFFGTSRKQILNKIDTFLGKPSTVDESTPELSGVVEEYDTGLVSSRISLFHNISQTEEPQLARRKCQSMFNIFQRRDSERNVALVSEDPKPKASTEHLTGNQRNKQVLERKYVTIDTGELKKELEDISKNKCVKDKRARMVQNHYVKTVDDTSPTKPLHWQLNEVQGTNVKKTIKGYNKQSDPIQKYKNHNNLRKSSMSKSEMDIFTKITNKPVEDDLDKYKSCDELPKVSVKNVISLYESVSKTDVKKPVKHLSRTSSLRLQRFSPSSSSTGAVNTVDSARYISKINKPTSETDESTTDLTPSPINRWNKEVESMSSGSYEPRSLDSIDIDIIATKDLEKQTTYVSLSDIELEIVENENISTENEPVKEKMAETAPTDYKSRFKMAKDFFKSLEEISEESKPKKPNECELLLMNKYTESLENERSQKRVKKYIKSHSMPSSEISKIWKQLQESQDSSNTNKLVKISEKFNIEDLFNDVTEGKLSRQGSLRGIPHKKAVLEAFRSMENLTDAKISSYEMAVSQLNEFAKENQIKNAQTYLSEYPYLPKTDPSKYHSRLDAKATGLVTLKELHNRKPRRNSVPDLRLNPTFTVQL
uniref:Uncharacterized protein n=1 Tax=Pectinophora gossypiella TaxID=13191 RepID=A0A1E1WTA1_PECGO